jgi:DNA-binding transcriptional MerR regulator
MTNEGHTIGEVLNRLKQEFDDVSISKIRFLESEGLVRPGRSDSGYRQFTDEDVDRLRYVLTQQRDRYLPLKVIKDELSRLDAGLLVDAEAIARRECGSRQPAVRSQTPRWGSRRLRAAHRRLARSGRTGACERTRRWPGRGADRCGHPRARRTVRRCRPQDGPCRCGADPSRPRAAPPARLPPVRRSRGRPDRSAGRAAPPAAQSGQSAVRIGAGRGARRARRAASPSDP